MTQPLEDKLSAWAQSPSKSETDRCDNAVGAVRNAIDRSEALRHRNIKVIAQGSYRNRTNVRRESDVDVGVICYDTFFYDSPPGTTGATFAIDPATYSYDQFKDDVSDALRHHFGSRAVTRGNKAFDVRETSHHVEADVAPFFEHRRYAADGSPISGVELRPDNGIPLRVINWPEHRYENGRAKNDRTKRSYRALARILKSLRNEMTESHIAAAAPITGFLAECLTWNVPDPHFANANYTEDLRGALQYIYTNTQTDDRCSEWGEVSELKYLFRPSQKWTRAQANDFTVAAWWAAPQNDTRI